MLRAIHGGGPNKGKDYFALCGSTHWLEGAALTDDCDPVGADPEDRAAANLRPSGTAAAGDIDGDGFPEIVVTTIDGGIELLNNRGELLVVSATGLFPSSAGGAG
ncbi:MAG TPA: hypothetical protein VM686_23180, partial [Polyangiaceae bacterium]|nr:hypothetical protein [Polyangiaceae bacterium]